MAIRKDRPSADGAIVALVAALDQVDAAIASLGRAQGRVEMLHAVAIDNAAERLRAAAAQVKSFHPGWRRIDEIVEITRRMPLPHTKRRRRPPTTSRQRPTATRGDAARREPAPVAVGSPRTSSPAEVTAAGATPSDVTPRQVPSRPPGLRKRADRRSLWRTPRLAGVATSKSLDRAVRAQFPDVSARMRDLYVGQIRYEEGRQVAPPAASDREIDALETFIAKLTRRTHDGK